jgi:hypothetical protein
LVFQEDDLNNPLVILELVKQISMIEFEGAPLYLLGLPDSDQKVPDYFLATLRLLLKASVFLQDDMYDSRTDQIRKEYPLQMPDPFTSSSGFFTLSLFLGREVTAKAVTARTEVFYYFDFKTNGWCFQPKEENLIDLSYDLEQKKIHIDFKTPLDQLKLREYLIQLRNLRTTSVSLNLTQSIAQDKPPDSDPHERSPIDQMTIEEAMQYMQDPVFTTTLNIIQDVLMAHLNWAHAIPSDSTDQLKRVIENVRYSQDIEQMLDQYSHLI